MKRGNVIRVRRHRGDHEVRRRGAVGPRLANIEGGSDQPGHLPDQRDVRLAVVLQEVGGALGVATHHRDLVCKLSPMIGSATRGRPVPAVGGLCPGTEHQRESPAKPNGVARGSFRGRSTPYLGSPSAPGYAHPGRTRW